MRVECGVRLGADYNSRSGVSRLHGRDGSSPENVVPKWRGLRQRSICVIDWERRRCRMGKCVGNGV